MFQAIRGREKHTVLNMLEGVLRLASDSKKNNGHLLDFIVPEPRRYQVLCVFI